MMIYKILIITFFNFCFNSTLNTYNDYSVTYHYNDEHVFNVKIEVGDVLLSPVNINNQDFIRLNTPGSYLSRNIGEPEIPQFNQLIEIPHNAIPRIEIIEENSISYNLNDFDENIRIYPSQPSVPKSNTNNTPFEYNESIYNSNKYMEIDLIELKEKGKLREIRIGNLIVSPFKYNPKTNELVVYTDIEFNIHFDNANLELTKTTKEEFASPYFETIFRNSIINYSSPYSSTRDNNFMEDKVTYVIVANQVFDGYLDDFINWKSKKGYDVVVAYTNEIGSSAAAIKSYIQQQYQNPDNNLSPASFVLLVGDTQQIPASYSSGGHVSDLDYCDFSGDSMPEVLCGRFSAQTPTQLLSQIEKTLEYEQYTMPDPSFLEDVIMISGVDASFAPTYGNGQINYGNNYYFNNNNQITSHTFLYPESGSSGTQILNLANQGASFINYTAHGWESGWADPEFDLNDVNNMSNNNKYPTMVGNCCLTNAFDTGTCFGEALLRKSNGGAIGYIGGSDVTYWDEDFWWGVGSGNVSSNPNYNSTGEGAYDGMFHENNEDNWAVVNSAIILVGNLAVAQANGMDDYYWEIYHLMGDPSLSTYMGVPGINNVTYNPFLPIGSEAIEIQANPYSYVGLTHNGDLISSGFVEDSGYLVLVFDPLAEPGTLELTVTAQDTQPFFGEIYAASPDGAYVTVNEVSLQSESEDTISIGETVSIEIILENVGNELSENITINLSEISNSPYVNIINGSYLLDELNVGEIFTTSLDFSVSNESPYGHAFILNLEINSDSNTYSNDFTLNVENLIDSFESGFSNLSWDISNGDEDWAITMGETASGLYSSKSGNIDHNMFSELSINMEIVEDGNISFYKKISCEDVGSSSGNYYDYLAFYIDNIEQSKWAGEQGWSSVSFPVTTGNHMFTWKFIKDQGVSSGQDAVWVDQIEFPPTFYSDVLLGDINGDSLINIQDIILAVNHILSSSNYNESIDMNSDDVIDILDVILLVNTILQG